MFFTFHFYKKNIIFTVVLFVFFVKTLICLLKTGKWLIGNLLFGAYPFITLYIIISTLNTHNDYKNIEGMMFENIGPIISIGMVGSIVIDYMLSDRKRSGDRTFLFVLLPVFLIIPMSSYYILFKLLCAFNVTQINSLPNADSVYLITVPVSLIFIVTTKTILNIESEESSLNNKFND